MIIQAYTTRQRFSYIRPFRPTLHTLSGCLSAIQKKLPLPSSGLKFHTHCYTKDDFGVFLLNTGNQLLDYKKTAI
jgi:hypothetical protein